MILKVYKLNIYHLACFMCLTQCLVLYTHNIFSSSPPRCSCSVTKSCPTLHTAPVFPMNLQGWFPLGLTGLISLLSKGFSRVFSNTTVRKHQFFSTQPSAWSNSHIHTWLLEKPFWLHGPLSAKWCLCFLIHCLELPLLFFEEPSIF